MTTDHEERMSPDDLVRAELDYEATLDGAGGAAYELPPYLAQHVMRDFQAWDGMEEFEAWRAQQAKWWEAE
ncbi:MAG TPA: hypothetical protein VKF37_08655, partial [Chloroflexota bacterium]|nr:hypothetical protein [Chloroflexota bacterium]